MAKWFIGLTVIAVALFTIFFFYERGQRSRVARFISQKKIAADAGRQLVEYLQESASCLCKTPGLAEASSVPFLRAGCSNVAPVLLSVGQLYRGLRVRRIEMARPGQVLVHWDSGGLALEPTELKFECGK